MEYLQASKVSIYLFDVRDHDMTQPSTLVSSSRGSGPFFFISFPLYFGGKTGPNLIKFNILYRVIKRGPHAETAAFKFELMICFQA